MLFNYYFLELLLIPGIILAIIAQIKVSYAYNRYSSINNKKNITGKDAALLMLQKAGITDVDILKTSGRLTDNYNPSNKTLNLSNDVYEGNSIAAISVACHEAGHAIQHHKNSLMLKLRGLLIPIYNIGNYMLMPLIILTLISVFLFPSANVSKFIVYFTVGLFFVSMIISLITLPIEIDASKKAKNNLLELGLIEENEVVGVKKVLNAAALTYVAGLVISILNLLRILLLFKNND